MSAVGLMKGRKRGSRRPVAWLACGLLLAFLPASTARAAGYGRLAGLVFDTQGTPLMGATVIILGPTAVAMDMTDQTLERVITDAHGRFTVDHLLPGWYSLKVSSPTRLPAMRNGVRVAAGETAIARFVLADTFAAVRFQVPNSSVSTWGDDWKWVLRTSSTTRPILRYREETREVAKAPSKRPAKQLPADGERLLGILPGTTRRDPLAGDTGFDSVVAYFRPLTRDSDLLVAGSFSPASTQAGSLATAFRRITPRGDSEEVGLVVHQFSLAGGFPIAGQQGFPRAQGMALSYSETRLVAPKVMVTAGMDVNYLNALGEVLSAQPHLKLEYQAAESTVVAVQYGSGRADGTDNLMDRIGLLNAFPRITERDYRLKLERLNHTEISVTRRIGKTARLQAAAFHDDLHNAAVWGAGGSSDVSWLAGNYLPNPAAQNGLVLNAGSYAGPGFRAVYSQTFGKHTEALVDFASGRALVTQGAADSVRGNWQEMLRAEQTNSVTGKFSSELPVTHTRVVTSYEWVPDGRVSLSDPYGQALLQTQPYLGVQIRQPLPITFLPVHVEALADFRNLLGQGYVPVNQGANGKPLLLSSGYRCFRGGFSVQF